MNLYFLPRRILHGLKMRLQPLSVGVRALVEDDRKRILLIRHTYVPGWHFPGGGVEPGETTQAAIAREVREEALVQLTGTPELVGVYLNHRFSHRDHVVLFRCRNWKMLADFRPTLEVADMKFFDPQSMPPDLSLGTARRIGELFDGQEVSPHW